MESEASEGDESETESEEEGNKKSSVQNKKNEKKDKEQLRTIRSLVEDMQNIIQEKVRREVRSFVFSRCVINTAEVKNETL